MKRALALLVLGLACRKEQVVVRADDAHVEVGPRGLLQRLPGTWIAEGSKRRVLARAEGDRVTFHVVTPSEWSDAYAPDEVRFVLYAHPSEGIRVIDRYRPFTFPSPGHYDDASAASCLHELREVDGVPLSARVLDDDRIEVEFAEVHASLAYDSDASTTIVGCRDVSAKGKIVARLHRTLP